MIVCSIVGARPQFVKASVVSRALKDAGIAERMIHTGQHYDTAMSSAFFDELGIPEPTVNLGVGSGSHAVQTAEMLRGIASFLENAGSIRGVIVYGDTNSTLAAVVASTKLHLPVFHVEAGLRSFNRNMPEELNRIVTDRLSELLFCPTQTAVTNLAKEGIVDGVHLVGDVMLEAVRFAAESSSVAEAELDDEVTADGYYLATIHRASNVDDPAKLKAIIKAIGELDRPVVFPVHPRTSARLADVQLPANIKRINPVSYMQMVKLVKDAEAVLTDSGGLQKEAYWLGTRCITLRNETEWIETLKGNWNQLVGADPDRILKAISVLPEGERHIEDHGTASASIVSLIQG